MRLGRLPVRPYPRRVPGHVAPAIPPDEAARLAELRALGATVATGRFRTNMAVELVNDGPVTLMLET